MFTERILWWLGMFCLPLHRASNVSSMFNTPVNSLYSLSESQAIVNSVFNSGSEEEALLILTRIHRGDQYIAAGTDALIFPKD